MGHQQEPHTIYQRKPFEPIVLFYHLTRPENLEQIEREGLRANAEGDIFAFTDWIAADTIAANQTGANPYALFRIHPSGITGDLFTDEVAELSAPLQCIIRQDRIESQFLDYLGIWPVREDLTPWQHLVYAQMGMSRQHIEAMICTFERAKENQHA